VPQCVVIERTLGRYVQYLPAFPKLVQHTTHSHHQIFVKLAGGFPQKSMELADLDQRQRIG
jgi:hypothetical protein